MNDLSKALPMLEGDIPEYLKSQKCGCYSCLHEVTAPESIYPVVASTMVVCPDCGNKRCPKGTHHDNQCTDSNEAGQEGSRYGALRN